MRETALEPEAHSAPFIRGNDPDICFILMDASEYNEYSFVCIIHTAVIDQSIFAKKAAHRFALFKGAEQGRFD
ncbi:MAG: hypothetical protein LLF96_00660 [Eubacteriales bacterium]|nr:hypothetical protein [Eubacteriales bacterium]